MILFIVLYMWLQLLIHSIGDIKVVLGPFYTSNFHVPCPIQISKRYCRLICKRLDPERFMGLVVQSTDENLRYLIIQIKAAWQHQLIVNCFFSHASK